MGSRTDTRDRMLHGAAALLAEHGVAGATVAAVLARSGTPRGSVSHHFPGGRAEMIKDTVLLVGDRVAGHLRSAVESEEPPERIIDAFCALYRDQLISTDFAAGCPV